MTHRFSIALTLVALLGWAGPLHAADESTPGSTDPENKKPACVEPPPKAPMPSRLSPGLHVVFDATPFAVCVRDHDSVGSSGACAEGAVGLDYVFWERWHGSLVLGAGWMGPRTQGHPDLGVAYSAGGSYGVARAMVGREETKLFFWRAGAQVRSGYTLDFANPGVQGVVDMGARAVRGLEAGMRANVGVDGVIAHEDGSPHIWHSSFAYGMGAFLRYEL